VSYTRVHGADDVTDEIIGIAQSVYAGWYGDGQRIDWEDLIDRVDGAELGHGTRLDLGDAMDSPASKKIKSEMRSYSKL